MRSTTCDTCHLPMSAQVGGISDTKSLTYRDILLKVCVTPAIYSDTTPVNDVCPSCTQAILTLWENT